MKLKVIFKNIYFNLRRFILHTIPIKIKESDLKAIEIKSILVIRIDRIGDLIVSIPALKALRGAFPKAKISSLVRKGNDALLGGSPWNDEVICYRGFIKSAWLLRQKKFDLAVDLLMDYPLKVPLLTYLINAKFSFGFDIKSRGRFFNLALIPSLEKKQVSKYMLDLVRLIGKSSRVVEENIEELDPQLFISEANEIFADEFLRNGGIAKGDMLFGLHPGGQFPSQRWMLESFAELAQKVSQKFKAKIVIVGSSKEGRLVKGIVSLMKIKPLLAVGLALDKLASIIAKTDIFICNNSGPLHIAVALGRPTVSTMGPTDPDLWWPHGKNHIVVRHNLTCSPCNRGFCRHHKCMELITISEMEKAVDIQMERIGRRDKAWVTQANPR